MSGDSSDDTPREHDSQRYAHAAYRCLAAGAAPGPSDETVAQWLDRWDARLDRHDREIDSLMASRSFWKKVAGFVLPLAFTTLSGLLVYSMNRLEASSERAGEVKAEIRAINRLIELLESDIAELRRHAGLDSKLLSSDGRIGAL